MTDTLRGWLDGLAGNTYSPPYQRRYAVEEIAKVLDLYANTRLPSNYNGSTDPVVAEVLREAARALRAVLSFTYGVEAEARAARAKLSGQQPTSDTSGLRPHDATPNAK